MDHDRTCVETKRNIAKLLEDAQLSQLNSTSNENPEQFDNLADKKYDKINHSTGNQANYLIRNRIRVIRTKLPVDFFEKAEPNLAEYTPTYKVKTGSTMISAFQKEQSGEEHNRSPQDSMRKAYLENGEIAISSNANHQAEQTANFFYFNASQSTSYAKDSKPQQTQIHSSKQRILNSIRRKTKSKAQNRIQQPKSTVLQSRGATALPTPRAVSPLVSLKPGQHNNIFPRTNLNDDFGCTFFDKNFGSTPSSPRLSKYPSIENKSGKSHQKEIRPNEKNSIKNSFTHEKPYFPESRRSKSKKSPKKDRYEQKIMENLWKEPQIYNKKGRLLPYLNMK